MAQNVCMMMITLIMIGCHLEVCNGMENMSKEDHLTPMETKKPAGVPDPICVRNCMLNCHSQKERSDCIIGCGSSVSMRVETIRPAGVPDPICLRNCRLKCHSKEECADCSISCASVFIP